ncbi:ATP-dependent DNA helicase Rep [Bacillus sp. M6-12]|uniref:UvrD-helicase domain-containing protein n=1 Tax=Bacillus sp. M6-12 TaxID=2054166 RepID=UPI000C78EC7A|nr:ATP-dependent helicase [Bacillus sp. M6-12]PLS16010.1 ATP-dependent DNA helicase Rep [Bacillus sp. M6-12]
MKKAIYQNNTVDLAYLCPERLQSLYENGKKGELSCLHCKSPVKLYLGIQEEPHFYHISKTETNCNDFIKESSAPIAVHPQEDSYVEQGGFRIPKSRAIIKEQQAAAAAFAKSRPIAGNPPHIEKSSASISSPPNYLSELNSSGVTLDGQQLLAASAIDGPVLLVSGAGSGKTRVLTVRTAFMITELGIDPRSIMLVTFTVKAAKEMKERLLSYPQVDPSAVQKIVSGTFHSIFFKILIHHEPAKWRRDLLLSRDWERQAILQKAGRELELDEKEFAYDQALQQIGLWKNTLIFPNDVKPETEWEETCKILYERYEEHKQQTGSYDFDDMLVGCHNLFRDNPLLLERYQNRFSYFLIDEFQDINKVQYELILSLSRKNRNVCVVGDDDQSIYSFRGSDPSFIQNFPSDFPGAKVIKLTENYRSSHEIVATANRIIKRNQNRLSKAMRAQHNFGAPPMLFYPYDEEQEATMIVTDIQEKIAEGARPGDFAVLYRTHSMSRAMFERLAVSNLPFRIESDAESFYNRRIVKGMLAFLRLSLDPDDPKAVSEIISALFLKQSVLQEIKAQSILQDCNLIEAFSFIKTAHAFQQKKLKALPKQIQSLRSLSPIVALEVIEKELGYQEFVKKRGNEGNIEKGSDDVRDLKVAAKRFETIAAFLEHADHMRAMNSEVKQLSKHFSDAIQLTTIHRAKGLEYKNVYVLGVVDGGLPHDYSLEALRKGDSSALEEERRLLYVAMTRAETELYLSVPQTRRGKTAHQSRLLKL